MLSDLLKAVQMITDAVKGRKAPERRRHEIGKRLATICLDIDEIVRSGREIMSALNGSRMITLKKLRIQQQALKKAMKDLKHPDVSRVLGIHLPKINSVDVLFEPKSGQLGFIISQLVTGRRMSRRKREELEYKLISEEEHSFEHPSMHSLTFAPYQCVDRKPSRLAWMLPPLLLFNWLLPRKNDGMDTANVGLFALKEDIREAHEVLTRIEESNEKLRSLVTSTFKIEDIV